MKNKSAGKPRAKGAVAMVVLPGSTRHAVPKAKLLKKSDPKSTIQVSIYVRRNPTPPGKSLALLGDMNDKLPSQRQYVDDAQYNDTFGAAQDDLDEVAAWAKSSGLSVSESSIPMRRVMVKGTIANISKAFGVQLNDYDHPECGKFRGRVGEIRIPAALAGIITGVFGLDTRQVGHPRIRRANVRPVDVDQFRKFSKGNARTVTHALPAPPFPGTFFPPTVAELYNYPGDFTGTGQNVAIFAFNGTGPDPHGGYRLAALQGYFEQVLGGKTPSIKDVVVQGPGNDPGPDSQASSSQGDATGEVMLDMCVVGSVAPGANIFMYFTEFTSQGWLDGLNQAITDGNKIDVISISYGNPEDDPDGAWTAMGVQQVNQVFEGAAAKGITICCASGDDGSSDQVPTGAHVDFPASSPYVLGVGGTKLVATSGITADDRFRGRLERNDAKRGCHRRRRQRRLHQAYLSKYGERSCVGEPASQHRTGSSRCGRSRRSRDRRHRHPRGWQEFRGDWRDQRGCADVGVVDRSTQSGAQSELWLPECLDLPDSIFQERVSRHHVG